MHALDGAQTGHTGSWGVCEQCVHTHTYGVRVRVRVVLQNRVGTHKLHVCRTARRKRKNTKRKRMNLIFESLPNVRNEEFTEILREI